jgi:Lrp/AsnC family transcriptional regulator, leucine-responsive regulatory protein
MGLVEAGLCEADRARTRPGGGKRGTRSAASVLAADAPVATVEFAAAAEAPSGILLPVALDEIDTNILRCLTEDGRMSFRDLGERVSLSPNAARDRVRALVARGVITGFHAHVDIGRVDRRLRAIVDVRLRSPDHAEQFERLIRAHPGVEEAVHLTGPSDYVVRVACADTTELDDLIRSMKEEGGVRDTQTRLVLRIVS